LHDDRPATHQMQVPDLRFLPELRGTAKLTAIKNAGLKTEMGQ